MFFFGKADSGIFMQCEWDPIWSSVVSNSNGSSGWARILRSGGDDVPEGVCRRVHLCAWKHAMLDGLQANMGQWDHRFIFNPRHLKRCPLAQSLPLAPLYIQEISRHQRHVTRSCGHSPRSPQLRGPMQQTQDTRYSAEYWPWPEKSDHRGHMWVIVSVYCWGLQEHANRMCGRDTTE